MDRPLRNIAASVRQRLLNIARSTGRPFQEVMQYFGMERFLYRLSQSPHADRFVLKGALMFNVWGAPASRPTRDIDFLAYMNNDVEAIETVMRDICLLDVEPDGLIFDADSLAGQMIKEDADYSGVRVTFLGYLENARIPMQIDIGFGDVVIPEAGLIEYPTILELDAPTLRGYPRETVVAEKLEAMVKLGQLNTRMKDFFDLWMLSRQFEFDGPSLATAISKTFANRQTTLTSQPVALTSVFSRDMTKQSQWRGFLRKSKLDTIPEDFSEVTEVIGGFSLPLMDALVNDQSFEMAWSPPGPWRPLI